MSDKKIYNGFEFFDKLRERMYRDEKIVKAGKGLKLNDVNTLSVDNGDGIAFDDNDKVTVNGEELLATEEQAGTVYITETPDEWHDKDPDKIALNVVGFNKEKASLVHTINNVKTKLESLLQIKKVGSGLEFDEESNTLSVNVGNGLEFDEESKVQVNPENILASVRPYENSKPGTVYLTQKYGVFEDHYRTVLSIGGFQDYISNFVWKTKHATRDELGLVELSSDISDYKDKEYTTLNLEGITREINALIAIMNELISSLGGDGLTYNSETKKLSLNTATDTTLGGVKVSNTIDVEEPADNLVPNVVAIQDGLDQYVFPAFEFIPMTYSNGLIFNKDESNLRIELGDGLKVNDSGGLSVETTDTIKSGTDLTLIPTLKALKPYRSEIIKSTHSAEIKEEQIYLSAGLMHIYVKYAFNQPETGNQVVLRIPITTLDEFSVRPKIPSYDQYVTSCVIQHNDTETLELARYTFMDTPAQNYYDFTVKPDNVTDGDIVILTVTVPVSALS